MYPYEILRRNREKKAVLSPDIDRERLEVSQFLFISMNIILRIINNFKENQG